MLFYLKQFLQLFQLIIVTTIFILSKLYFIFIKIMFLSISVIIHLFHIITFFLFFFFLVVNLMYIIKLFINFMNGYNSSFSGYILINNFINYLINNISCFFR